MDGKRLILLVGLPYADNSRWALNQACPVVSEPAIRKALFGVSHRDTLVAAQILDVERLMRAAVVALFLAGHDRVIVDDERLVCRAHRRGWKQEGREPWGSVVCKVFRTDRETCIQRAVDAGDAGAAPHIDTLARGFDELHSAFETELEEVV